jgi:siroheme synthase-like protein
VLLDVDVRGWRCLVVGAGPVGSRRALRLVRQGAEVHVGAPDATEDVVAAAAAGSLRWSARPFEVADASGCRLVVLASGDDSVDELAAASVEPGALVNRAGAARRGDLRFPAVAVEDGVVVTVATPAQVPALSSWVARRVAGALDGLVGLDPEQRRVLADLLAEVRAEVPGDLGGSGVDWRTGLDRSMLDPVLLDHIRAGRRAEAKERLQACLSSS